MEKHPRDRFVRGQEVFVVQDYGVVVAKYRSFDLDNDTPTHYVKSGPFMSITFQCGDDIVFADNESAFAQFDRNAGAVSPALNQEDAANNSVPLT